MEDVRTQKSPDMLADLKAQQSLDPIKEPSTFFKDQIEIARQRNDIKRAEFLEDFLKRVLNENHDQNTKHS